MKENMQGLVIWETKTGETDRVITILTEHGVITAYARSSLRPNNKLTSSTSMLSLSYFELFSGKGMYTVDDAQSKLKFSKIFTDVKGYALAVYFCELLRQLAPINDKSEEFLALALNSLHLINEQKKPLLLIKSVFELRLLSYSGYMPDIVACSECGEFTKDDVYFDFRKSTIMCKKCAAKLSVRCNCSSAVLMSMRHIVYSEPSKIFSFTLSETQLELLTKLSERYVTEQIEKELQTLRFFKSL